MARRKPLPYHASMAVDEAVMHNTDAVRSLLPLVNGQAREAGEIYRLIGKAVYHVEQSTSALREIRMTNNGE
jgi:hypothetical protein